MLPVLIVVLRKHREMRKAAKRTGFGSHRRSDGGGNDRGDDGNRSDGIDGRHRGVRRSSGAHNLDTSEMRKNREELSAAHCVSRSYSFLVRHLPNTCV